MLQSKKEFYELKLFYVYIKTQTITFFIFTETYNVGDLKLENFGGIFSDKFSLIKVGPNFYWSLFYMSPTPHKLFGTFAAGLRGLQGS